MNDDIPLFLTVMDLAKLLRVGRWTIFNYIRQGRLPQPQRITSRNVRWHRDDLADVLRFGPMPAGHFDTAQPAELGDAITKANAEVSEILQHADQAAEAMQKAQAHAAPTRKATKGKRGRPKAAANEKVKKPRKKRTK